MSLLNSPSQIHPHLEAGIWGKMYILEYLLAASSWVSVWENDTLIFFFLQKKGLKFVLQISFPYVKDGKLFISYSYFNDGINILVRSRIESPLQDK